MFTTANPEVVSNNQAKIRYLKQYTQLEAEIRGLEDDLYKQEMKLGGITSAMFSPANQEAVGGKKDNQEKIKYLKRYIILDQEIDRKVLEIEKWRGTLGKVTAVYSSEPKGGGSIYGKTETIVAKIVDLDREIVKSIDDLVDLRPEIVATIDKVDDDRERLLLMYRYIDGKTFEWIAGKMFLSWRQIHRLHSQALLKVVI